MHLVPERPDLRLFLQTDNGEQEVVLSEASPEEFFKNDLVNYRLTGTIPQGPDFRIVNFVGCILHDVRADGVDFSECDFKDSLLNGATFSSCKFDGGTFATTFFSDTEFRECTFYNLAAHSCDFRRVQFINCDLTNLLVKSSRFSQCSFENCITSNKICEMSTLFDVTFSNTAIQIDTIVNNFGITSDHLHHSQIRSGRVREAHSSLSIEHLTALVESEKGSALERLSLEYFLTHTLLNGSPRLDQSLDITRWTRIYRNPGSFIELLDKFAEFLIYLYDENRLALHAIILLHHVTGTLADAISPGEKLHRVAISLGGTHLILSRIVEEFLQGLDLASQSFKNSIVLLVDGPEDPAYFQDALGPWIQNEGVVISRLRPRNSPLSLELTASNAAALLPVLAVFLATRTKLEITRLRTTLEQRSTGKEKKPGSKPSKAKNRLLPKSSHRLLELRSGFVTKPSLGYELQLRSLIPGSLLIDLRLNFSTSLLQRLRKILLDLLDDSSDKGR
jgi:uncharacterized protein YjbI with pentapeptide repeats